MRKTEPTLQKKSFIFSSANQKALDQEIAKYPEGQQASALLAALYLGQAQNKGWLSMEVMDHIAKILNIPLPKVYEVARFYSLYYTEPVGKYMVQVCESTSCWLQGSPQIMKACQKWLDVQENETTSDQKFTFKSVECLGACIHGPVIQINDIYHKNITSAKIPQILEDLAYDHKVSEKK